MTLLVVFMWICKYMTTLGRNDSPITVFARVMPPLHTFALSLVFARRFVAEAIHRDNPLIENIKIAKKIPTIP